MTKRAQIQKKRIVNRCVPMETYACRLHSVCCQKLLRPGSAWRPSLRVGSGGPGCCFIRQVNQTDNFMYFSGQKRSPRDENTPGTKLLLSHTTCYSTKTQAAVWWTNVKQDLHWSDDINVHAVKLILYLSSFSFHFNIQPSWVHTWNHKNNRTKYRTAWTWRKLDIQTRRKLLTNIFMVLD